MSRPAPASSSAGVTTAGTGSTGAGLPATVGVVGGGTMGAGIAHALLAAGVEVVLAEVDDAAAQAARARVTSSLERAAARGQLLPLPGAGAEPEPGAGGDTGPDPAGLAARLDTTTALGDLARAGVVVEAVPESVALKREVLTRLAGPSGPVRPPAVVATNTSSLSIDVLASAVDGPERFAGAHFFNPVPASSLVEVVRGAASSSATLAAIHALAAGLGKESIEVADSPGFATSRLGLALGLEAVRMVEDGVASPEDVDRAMVLGYKHPVGPLRLTDLVGLDVRLGIAEYLTTTLGDRFRPPALLRDKVARGELGRKSGRGFYDWPPAGGTAGGTTGGTTGSTTGSASSGAGGDRR